MTTAARGGAQPLNLIPKEFIPARFNSNRIYFLFTGEANLSQTDADTKFARLKWRRAFNNWERKAAQWIEVIKTGYDPNQPRVPAGNSDGGQWAGGGGGAGDSPILSDANPNFFTKPGTRVAQARRRRSGARPIIINGVPHTPTPGQAARYSVAKAQSRAVRKRVNEIDPNWKPRPGAVDGIQGQISQFRAEAREARVRLRELASQPPTQLINTYRSANNSRDLFGNETWPRDRDTVSVSTINRIPFVGVNSSAPTYTTRDRRTAEIAVDTLVAKYPKTMKRGNIGQMPNNALFHAESTILLRAARANGGSLAKQRFEVRTDRNMCPSCEIILPKLGQELGNPTVTFVSPNGTRRTMRDGKWVN